MDNTFDFTDFVLGLFAKSHRDHPYKAKLLGHVTRVSPRTAESWLSRRRRPGEWESLFELMVSNKELAKGVIELVEKRRAQRGIN